MAQDRQVYASASLIILVLGMLAVVWRAVRCRASPGASVRLRVHQEMLPSLAWVHTRHLG